MRRETDLALANMPHRFDMVERRITGIEEGLLLNTEVTQSILSKTRTLVDGIQSATSFWAFMTKWAKRFAVFMKYVGFVAAAGAAIYAFAEHIAQFDIMNWRRK